MEIWYRSATKKKWIKVIMGDIMRVCEVDENMINKAD